MAQLAQIAGISERTIRRIEEGKPPSPATLQALAAAFNVDIVDLNPGPRDAPVAPSRPGGVETEDTTRAGMLRQLLVSDMVGWRKQAMFAAALEVLGLHRMPLEDFYVEPIVRVDGKSRGACCLIRELVTENAIVVVSAPYGHGKSLTAKILASTLASEWVEAERPRPQCLYPIYVPLGLHASSARDLDVDLLIRRATKERARALGHDLELSDASYAPPDPQERSLVILDGLDEVHFDPRDIDQLFRLLRDQSSSGRRFLIFTRPEVLRARMHPAGTVQIQLEAFDTRQIARWLDSWNETIRPTNPITYKDLEARGFHQIAKIPIILFLTAFCWDAHVDGANSDEASLYEHFARRLIEGKLAESRERQPRVDGVADQLVPALTRLGLVTNVVPADRREALLWLMGRIAWSDHIMEHIEERELTEQDVRDVVADELKIADFDAQSYRVTLLLGQQRDEAPARRSIFFGHRSFREFFVARHWLGRLRELLAFPARRTNIESELLRGPLLVRGSGCLQFLRLMLARTDADVRAGIAAWGREVFERDEWRWMAGQRQALRAERGASLRNIGLALQCEATTARVPVAKALIRSMLAGMWATDRWETLWAPRIVCPELDLSGTQIPGANLEGAEIRDATFFGVKANKASMRGLVAPRANLGHADLSSVDISGSTLNNANLDHSNFSNADLRGACLRECHVEGTNFVNADLRRTDLSKAEFDYVKFSMADLGDADLSGAVLKDVDFESANLTNASLAGARLIGSNLLESVLVGADLRGADLSLVREGLVVGECVFHATKYDARTRWPDGFEASAARGLVFVPD